MRNILEIVFVICGTLIGAGFASGKEIATFFNRFGNYGLFGCILACCLFGIITIYGFYVIQKAKVNSYEEMMGNHVFINWMVKIFLWICFCIMISGIGTFFQERFGLPIWVGSLLGAMICYITFLFDLKGIILFNFILVPFIILGVILVGSASYEPASLGMACVETNYYFGNHWLTSAILYTSYNSIILLPILTDFKGKEAIRRSKLWIGVLVSVIMAILGFLIFRVIHIFYPTILSAQMPMVTIAGQNHVVLKYFYYGVILISIFTSAISVGYSFLKMCQPISYKKNARMICILAVLLSPIGFGKLIDICYGIFGYLGIFQFLLMTRTLLCDKMKKT